MATKQANDEDEEPQPGIGVDARGGGGGVVDPTKNVLDLVKAESKKRDELREADKELVDCRIDAVKDNIKILSDGIILYQNGQREAETRRIDQLAQTRQDFSNTIRDMLAESVRTTSTLVRTQLVQIQATFDTRVSKLEAGAFTQAGKSSVADPALADALSRLGNGLSGMQEAFASSLAKMATTQAEAMTSMANSIGALKQGESRAAGVGIGQQAIIAYLVAAISIGAFIFQFLRT